MDVAEFEDDDNESFLSRLRITQKKIGSLVDGEDVKESKMSGKLQQEPRGPDFLKADAPLKLKLKPSVHQAEEDEDCDALWSMFDVNDLDEGIALPKARLSLAISQTQTASQGDDVDHSANAQTILGDGALAELAAHLPDSPRSKLQTHGEEMPHTHLLAALSLSKGNAVPEDSNNGAFDAISKEPSAFDIPLGAGRKEAESPTSLQSRSQAKHSPPHLQEGSVPPEQFSKAATNQSTVDDRSVAQSGKLHRDELLTVRQDESSHAQQIQEPSITDEQELDRVAVSIGKISPEPLEGTEVRERAPISKSHALEAVSLYQQTLQRDSSGNCQRTPPKSPPKNTAMARASIGSYEQHNHVDLQPEKADSPDNLSKHNPEKANGAHQAAQQSLALLPANLTEQAEEVSSAARQPMQGSFLQDATVSAEDKTLPVCHPARVHLDHHPFSAAAARKTSDQQQSLAKAGDDANAQRLLTEDPNRGTGKTQTRDSVPARQAENQCAQAMQTSKKVAEPKDSLQSNLSKDPADSVRKSSEINTNLGELSLLPISNAEPAAVEAVQKHPAQSAGNKGNSALQKDTDAALLSKNKHMSNEMPADGIHQFPDDAEGNKVTKLPRKRSAGDSFQEAHAVSDKGAPQGFAAILKPTPVRDLPSSALEDQIPLHNNLHQRKKRATFQPTFLQATRQVNTPPPPRIAGNTLLVPSFNAAMAKGLPPTHKTTQPTQMVQQRKQSSELEGFRPLQVANGAMTNVKAPAKHMLPGKKGNASNKKAGGQNLADLHTTAAQRKENVELVRRPSPKPQQASDLSANRHASDDESMTKTFPSEAEGSRQERQALMNSAREELQRRELNSQNFQSLESHLAKMHLETDSMRSKVLELRVKTAILGNRFVRLDNPILMAKTKDLAAKLADVMNAT